MDTNTVKVAARNLMPGDVTMVTGLTVLRTARTSQGFQVAVQHADGRIEWKRWNPSTTIRVIREVV